MPSHDRMSLIVFDLKKSGLEEKQIELFISNNRRVSAYCKLMSGSFIIRHAEDSKSIVSMMSSFLPNKQADFAMVDVNPDGLYGFLPSTTWDELSGVLGLSTKTWLEEN